MPELVHLGCGTKLYPPPWINIDPRRIETDTPGIVIRKGDAVNTGLASDSVELLFSNATFEHLYLPHVLPALREWRRILTPTGMAVQIGIPNFPEVARQYLAKGQGVTGDTFDLMEVHRYTLGFPEGHLDTFPWSTWSTTEHVDEAPADYLAQIHKAVYDADTLNRLLLMAGLHCTIWTYCYRDEPHPLNLAFAASRSPRTHTLDDVPYIDEYVNAATVQRIDRFGDSRLATFATWFDQ